MSDAADDVNQWEQLSLLPEFALELTLKLGVIPSHDHVQVQVEMSSPTDGKLLALWSLPHADLAHAEDAIHAALSEFWPLAHRITGPFL